MRWTNFKQDDRGIFSIEMVIVLPLLLFWFGAVYVFYSAFHTWLKSVKANYTIADLISRQTITNNSFIYALVGVFDSISETLDADNSYFVVTALQWHDHDDDPNTDLQMAIIWSEATNTPEQAATGVAIEDIEDRMPTYVPEFDQVIYVQSYSPFTPIWNWVGLTPDDYDASSGKPAIVFENDMVTTLRFSSQLDHEQYPDPDPGAYSPDDGDDRTDSSSGGTGGDTGTD